jgi:hypothetical protein
MRRHEHAAARPVLRRAAPGLLAALLTFLLGGGVTPADRPGPAADPGFRLLFMDEQDVQDVRGHITFVSNPLRPLRDPSGLEMENLVNVSQADGSWLAYGMDFVGGELPRRPRPAGEYVQVQARTTDGFTFTNLARRPWKGDGPGPGLFLQKTMAYNPETNTWLLLYFEFRSPLGEGYPGHAYISHDGLTFTPAPNNPVYYGHDAFHLMWDPRSKDFLCYQVAFQPGPKRYPDNAQQGRRVITIKRSRDGLAWHPPGGNIVAAGFPPEYLIPPDADDPEDLEFYWFTPFPYADRYVGLMLLYEPGPPEVNPRHPGQPGAHGPYLATEWWVSRDALHWSRPYRREYRGLEPDQSGAWASGYPGVVQTNPIVANGEVLFYGRWGVKEDRIGGAAAGPNAEFSSRPFPLPGRPLRLNATARWVGAKEHFQEKQAYIMVELLDKQGRAIPGYEKEKCYFQDVDASDLPLRWEGRDGVELAGRPARLRFYLRSARVYAVTAK